MATIRDLLSDAMIEAGVLAAGETLSDEDAQFALRKLNRLLDTWSADGFMVNAETQETVTLNAGGGATIGVGKVINTQVPFRITHAALLIDGSKYRLQILTADEWAEISNPDLVGQPTKIHLTSNDSETTLKWWPNASQDYDLELFSEKTISGGAFVLGDSLVSVPGMEAAIVQNLALAICPSYGIEPSQMLVKNAQDSYAAVARASFQPSKMVSDLATKGRFNIYTGEYET